MWLTIALRTSPGLEFADVIKNAPGMKHIVAIWIIDGTSLLWSYFLVL
jgi:hypothetical protein